MDNFEHALEKENERLRAEVERLTRERDEAQRALLLEQQVREAHRDAADDLRRRAEAAEQERDRFLRQVNDAMEALVAAGFRQNDLLGVEVGFLARSRDELKARAEAAEAETLKQCSISMRETERADKAEADNASYRRHVDTAAAMCAQDDAKGAKAILDTALAELSGGAALLEERKRIAKTLDTMDVPSEADEAEKGRACDFAGRVELLASWGQRGWREYQRLKGVEADRDENWREVGALMGVIHSMDPATFETLVASGGPSAKAAALLERLRAAEKVVEAARAEVTMSVPLEQAIAAYDALKEGA